MKVWVLALAASAAVAMNLPAAELSVTPERWPSTPYEAMERIHGDRKAGSYEGFTVRIAEGTYPLDRPIVLEPVDSSSGDAPIVFEGVPGKTVISGGIRITDWTEDGDGVWSAPLPQERGEERAYFEMMWVNGRRAQRARYPKTGFLKPSWTERRSDAVAAFVEGVVCVRTRAELRLGGSALRRLREGRLPAEGRIAGAGARFSSAGRLESRRGGQVSARLRGG